MNVISIADQSRPAASHLRRKSSMPSASRSTESMAAVPRSGPAAQGRGTGTSRHRSGRRDDGPPGCYRRSRSAVD
ncbi:hypothetical protein BZL30_9127 [Mycobacterium kansasii]|uniref:Uncharacterized protein n=1 Tax=Mycobacterium kansasii TaxID=1768 RepID=A0A1V3WDM7_MYCKA|nr:hypothetical protein BZL30_9127 [Mycobacterium kansasii]